MDILATLSSAKAKQSHKDDKEWQLDLIPWRWYKNWLIRYGANNDEVDEFFTFEPCQYWRVHLDYFEKMFNNGTK